MQKSKAIELLGGNTTAAAKAIGISYQAVNQWPDVLPPRIADRVAAALLRLRPPSGIVQNVGDVPVSMMRYLQHLQTPSR
jgi:hypothetical protein